MCIGIMEMWFGIANGQISLNFDRVISPSHDSGAVLSFHIFIFLVKMTANYAKINRVGSLDAGFQQVPLLQISVPLVQNF